MEETIWQELERFTGSIKDEIRSKKPDLISIDFWIFKIERRIKILKQKIMIVQNDYNCIKCKKIVEVEYISRRPTTYIRCLECGHVKKLCAITTTNSTEKLTIKAKNRVETF